MSFYELSMLFCLPGVWRGLRQWFLIKVVPPGLRWSLLETQMSVPLQLLSSLKAILTCSH